MTDERILAIDIGAGTMDTLVYDPAQPMENAVQLVLPSATSLAARKIAAVREQGKPVFLHGNLMGGYHTTNAVCRTCRPDWRSTRPSAPPRTVHDDLDLLRARGIVITDDPPRDAIRIEFRDVDLARLERTLAQYDVTLPETIAIAAQDHDFSPKASNRLFRFEHWRRFLTPGSTLGEHIWRTPPAYMTRLLAIQRDVPGAIVADTGPVAVLGALEDERVAERAAAGACIVNVGNQHVLGLLVRGETLLGVVEHHTEAVDTAKLKRLIARLVAGTITHDEVFADDGHGALVLDDYRQLAPFDFVAITGPNRRLAKSLAWYEAAPHGAMMLSGCFGLVRGVQRLREREAVAAR